MIITHLYAEVIKEDTINRGGMFGDKRFYKKNIEGKQ
jgi:hypothetical protein